MSKNEKGDGPQISAAEAYVNSRLLKNPERTRKWWAVYSVALYVVGLALVTIKVQDPDRWLYLVPGWLIAAFLVVSLFLPERGAAKDRQTGRRHFYGPTQPAWVPVTIFGVIEERPCSLHFPHPDECRVRFRDRDESWLALAGSETFISAQQQLDATPIDDRIYDAVIVD